MAEYWECFWQEIAVAAECQMIVDRRKVQLKAMMRYWRGEA